MLERLKSDGRSLGRYVLSGLVRWAAVGRVIRLRGSDTKRLIEVTITEELDRGAAYALSAAEWARAVLYNGIGRHEEAPVVAERASEHTEDLWL